MTVPAQGAKPVLAQDAEEGRAAVRLQTPRDFRPPQLFRAAVAGQRLSPR